MMMLSLRRALKFCFCFHGTEGISATCNGEDSCKEYEPSTECSKQVGFGTFCPLRDGGEGL
jgi:hypothetical protein